MKKGMKRKEHNRLYFSAFGITYLTHCKFSNLKRNEATTTPVIKINVISLYEMHICLF